MNERVALKFARGKIVKDKEPKFESGEQQRAFENEILEKLKKLEENFAIDFDRRAQIE